MTISEAKDLIINRIGWRNDDTLGVFDLSSANSTSNSGRYFQSEHSCITLQNIRDCQPIVNISEDKFNSYLEVLREQVVIQVLSDAFEKDYINDDLLTAYPTAFDNAISLRMVVVVAELIMTNGRLNKTQRFSEGFVGKLNYDIYRESPNKFAIRGANYKYSMGVATRYGFEIQSVQRRFGQQRNLIKNITKGQHFGLLPEDKYNIDEQYDRDYKWN
tara:strand:+ start:6713 stop:7363 length:651 start_codon:yes stop_codon:yes gene_type:complete